MTLDDDNAVGDAGLLLSGTLVERHVLERVADERVEVHSRQGFGLMTSFKLLDLTGATISSGRHVEDLSRRGNLRLDGQG